MSSYRAGVGVSDQLRGASMASRHSLQGSLVVVASVWLFSSPTWSQSMLHVDDDAVGANDGSSWCDAFVQLQDALLVATNSGGAVTEIRVAQGLYLPDTVTPGDRSATFQLLSSVALRGGYAGCGAANPNERDIVANETILSGDLNGDDQPEVDPPSGGLNVCCFWHPAPGTTIVCDDANCEALVCSTMPSCCDVEWTTDCGREAVNVCCGTCGITSINRCDNSYHVVTASAAASTTILDGFTITAGVAGGLEDRDRLGGGMIVEAGGPTITRCTFANNAAIKSGGAMSISEGAIITVRDCAFYGNDARSTGDLGRGGGGALYIVDSSVAIEGCTFERNESPFWNEGTGQGFGAGFGGAVYGLRSDVTVVDCLFHQNNYNYYSKTNDQTYFL